MPYRIEFTPAAREHVKAMRKRDQQIIYNAIARQLIERPDHPVRNRKKLEENVLAPWELRVRTFRVFYDVDREHERVLVVAVGQKVHNVFSVGGEEIEL
jgi:mRNA-degrading endonuclease RelE of RelBE toxin-antitoxin system